MNILSGSHRVYVNKKFAQAVGGTTFRQPYNSACAAKKCAIYFILISIKHVYFVRLLRKNPSQAPAALEIQTPAVTQRYGMKNGIRPRNL